jgi:hypothetical protein
MVNQRRPTKRAPDVWDSARFTSIFLASGFFYISSIVHARPHAGNASRWAHPCTTASKRESMKKFALLIILVLAFLTSCQATPVLESTATIAPANTTATIPPATATLISPPTLTPMPTEVVMPDFMKEFIDLGYDKQSLESDTIYVVFDEKSITYGTDVYGLKYKDAFITSWATVYYIQNSLLQKAYVITSYSVKSSQYTDLNPSWNSYLILSTNLKSNKLPFTINFCRGQFTQLFDHFIEKDYPILEAELNWQKFKTQNLGEVSEYFTTSLYPPFSGKLETLNIPGIGKVIPVTNFVLYPQQMQP